MKKLSPMDVIATLMFFGLTASCLTAATASFGSVPPLGHVTDDTAISQNLSEITIPRQGKISFDDDIQQLNQMEHRYHERLPRMADRPGIAAPMRRISTKKYVAKSKRHVRARIRKHSR